MAIKISALLDFDNSSPDCQTFLFGAVWNNSLKLEIVASGSNPPPVRGAKDQPSVKALTQT